MNKKDITKMDGKKCKISVTTLELFPAPSIAVEPTEIPRKAKRNLLPKPMIAKEKTETMQEPKLFREKLPSMPKLMRSDTASCKSLEKDVKQMETYMESLTKYTENIQAISFEMGERPSVHFLKPATVQKRKSSAEYLPLAVQQRRTSKILDLSKDEDAQKLKDYSAKMLGPDSEAAKLEFGKKDEDPSVAKARRQRVKQRYKLAALSVSMRSSSGRAQKVPPIVNLKVLVDERMKKLKDDTFVYLTYVVPRSSEYFTPYSLAVVPFIKVKKDEYFTMSRHGVTYWSTTENSFTELDVWMTDYDKYSKLSKIKIFMTYRYWKTFKVWRKTIQWKKFTEARKFIRENLFLVIPALARALMEIIGNIVELGHHDFVDITRIEDWTLIYFIERQIESCDALRTKLAEYHTKIRELIHQSCCQAIRDKGFLVEDEATVYKSARKLKEVMSFTDRANKRRFCERLCCFLYLVDYLTVCMLRNVLGTTFTKLAYAFSVHDAFAPHGDELLECPLDVAVEAPRPDGMPQQPLFNTQIILKPDSTVEIEPPRDLTLKLVNETIQFIMESTQKLSRFTSDDYYLFFTEPSIMGRKEERLSRRPPNLADILDNNEELTINRNLIPQIVSNAYDKVDTYMKKFSSICENYRLDLETNPSTIRGENNLEKLLYYCERYSSEIETLDSLVPSTNLGLLHINQESFKKEIMPVVKELQTIVHVHLPMLARQATKTVQEKAEFIHDKLMTPQEETKQFVNFMHYLDNCADKIEDLKKELEFAYQVLRIMKTHGIIVLDEIKDLYLDVEELLADIEETLAKKIENKQAIVEKLAESLQKDIKKIFDEVEQVRLEVVKPWFLDENSDQTQIRETLAILTESLSNCQELSQEYRKYQKEFKIDVTRFDTLEAVNLEVKMRQTLWDSVQEWKTAIELWNEMPFDQLNVEELVTVNTKILKNCGFLDKNLPKNDIVPKLKVDAEDFKEKLPVIGFLRNEALKRRHWIQIEQSLNKKILDEEHVNIFTFEDANAFELPLSEELAEISGQASAEAGLEALLKKVENSWKELELSIVPHRDAKDIFILAGIDELQTVLDESCINIATILASRHVGPIKERVISWNRQLDLFSETLEEWFSCQQTWIYLEAIFSAPDIQRQLPEESRIFNRVDKNWKEVMRKAFKTPLAISNMTDPNTLDMMRTNNQLLEQVTRSLEAYLELKRVAFPRFYFLSNDELLEILAQTRNPHAVQPHLRKCFDAIAQLRFKTARNEEGVEFKTNDITAMISPEGEVVVLQGLKARGAVEDWLAKVEKEMFASLKKFMKLAHRAYGAKDRSLWFMDHPNQLVLTVSQQQWAVEVHGILDRKKEESLMEMKSFEKKVFSDLTKLAAIARTDISKLLRKTLCALITIDVHALDTISNLVKRGVYRSTDFDWLKMLRYYWREDTETMEAKMASACLPYFYEYLGAGGVLVITPLTDRCYLCLMGALQMDLGGAPAGPAGTGKTETTKDLAKALAIQCVVFNCSEGLDYKMMGRFFSGLAQSGAWCCFDEFNRIDIEVLSVIAQQLITIRNAKAMKMKKFMFEGREIKLIPSCAAFITMNPGYAGRTELPDNLKALFRPISMMVPDYALIAEVILYSEGFNESKLLARKMVQMYKLCSEQLSQQDHYDFGMRAVKSVLVMAGALKRASPDQSEDITLICALRDSNLPKFLADDVMLFKGILSDLFPGVELPLADYGALEKAIIDCMVAKNLQPVPALVTKNIQLYETMVVRWGVMLVGPTGGGKSSVLHSLANAITKLYEDQVKGPNYREVKIQTLNPKAITLDELYGAVNSMTLEWKDGLLGLAVRAAVNASTDVEIHEWVVCDGPVDAVWIENLNTVLDDNKMLCLANSERIKLTPWVHMVFEVQDLSQASPATVSRCGMVYIDPLELGWKPLIDSWMSTVSELSQVYKDFVKEIFDEYFEKFLDFGRKRCQYSIHQVEVSKVCMMLKLLKSLIKEAGNISLMEKEEAKGFLFKMFTFTALWSIGCNYLESSKEALEGHIRTSLSTNPLAKLPDSALWNFCLNTQTRTWENWEQSVPEFKFDSAIAFFDMLVPTSDTARNGKISEMLFNQNYPVMFTGDTGVGKSVLAKSILTKLAQSDVIPVFMTFSAQTSSLRTQEMMESRLEKRKKTLMGAPLGKRIIIFVDDVNMPKLDTYGSQPPIELLRQFLDFRGVFDREKSYWKEISDVILGAACAPPGGGRNALTPRFVRHFGLLQLPQPSVGTLLTIFKAILRGFFDDFAMIIKPLADPIIEASVEIYDRISKELLPTPAKSHYVFNLRDLSKCIQGVLQADSSNYGSVNQILRLFYHEAMRVFHDRLINEEDKTYFKALMHETSVKYFEMPIVNRTELVLFGDFMIYGQAREDRIYEEIRDFEKLKSILMDYLEDYNGTTGKDMRLILFQDAVEHIIRLARLLRAERGNGLLVGVSGMGKQSLSRLASHLNGYECVQIELSRGYNHASFHDDLRKYYFNAGVRNRPTVFLITDTQIVREEFLEDINNILNSGEVPNLFESDEYEKIILNTRQPCIDAKYPDTSREGIFEFFVKRVRANLHVVICMSPVGDAFRRRCRMFPSLVNCCTIDWFVKWPPEALYSVALGSLKEVAENEEQCEHLATVCVMMHENVESISERLYEEMRRYYYTTPSSYLELLKQYRTLLERRSEAIMNKRDRISNGLGKLLETNELVAVMGEDLQKYVPIIEEKSRGMKELLIKLDKDSALADQVKKAVLKDEAEAKIKAVETQEIADEAARELEAVMPMFQAAQDALAKLKKNDVNEVRSFPKPPPLVKFVMEAVCILLGAKPDWGAAKVLMADANFLKRLQEYDKEHIPEDRLKKIRPYIEDKNFDPAAVAKQSTTAKSICLWVRAIDNFANVYKDVEPKVRRRQQAESDLKTVMKVLKQKQSELAEVEAKIEELKTTLTEKEKEMKILQDNQDLTAARLNRASRLTSALTDEEVRWKESVQELSKELWSIPGDVLVASACVAYLGAFPVTYRHELIMKWVDKCKSLNIPSGAEFNLIKVLGEPYTIRVWNVHGLPRDDVSVENGIIVTQASRWPLMIDPQEQANRWIRSMEKANDLKLAKMTDPSLMRTLEHCIRQGLPLLIEEVEETLDPALGPVLGRHLSVQGGRALIRLGDTDIDYDPRFRLYMTTKLSNPHYLPEICIQITLVNFLVTLAGLEDQLLADVVRIELPELEQKRNDLISRINADKQQLLFLEDQVLKLLFSSEGNILDDEVLVETLNEAKETSSIIATRLVDTEKTEESITAQRETFRPLAARGAILFFVVATLADVDPMYQFSLRYFSQVFCTVIEEPAVKMVHADRLKYLLDQETYAIYANISRGLFEKHKLIYSFLIAIAVEKQEAKLSDKEFDFLMRGPVGRKPETKKPGKLTDQQWAYVSYLEENFEIFKGITEDMNSLIKIELEDFTINLDLGESQAKVKWNVRLSSFQKLLLVVSLKFELLVSAIGSYVRFTLGTAFTEPPKNISLAAAYQDTNSQTPLVFVLSAGSDPMAALQKFATEKNVIEKLFSISLGQGQGPAAEKMLEKGRNAGFWVFLQNCHLSTSWMPAMEKIIRDIALGVTSTHPEFRIFLSSMPAKSFPVSVLQISVKITNEPPKGLRSNLIRALTDLDKDFFEQHVLDSNWRQMIFGICMFHGVILERRKFGPLGWNILYEFNESDRECALMTLDMFCEREVKKKIPWDALEYINGEITYGGRVTDNWDQRCLKTILKTFSSPKILVDDYKYSPNGVYRCPDGSKLGDFMEYVLTLPFNEPPEIFGMHENANIFQMTNETHYFINTLLEGQPRVGAGAKGSANDDVCLEMIATIRHTIVRKILTEEIHPELVKIDSNGRLPSLTTVLLQEVERFNRLLTVIHNSLDNLEKAIKGFIVMSDILEAVFDSFINNQVPRLWSSKGYLSTKSLGSWIIDFKLRNEYIQAWLNLGTPSTNWICGLFFPQSFLTGTLQTHARAHNLPIDALKIDFKILDQTPIQSEIYEKRQRGVQNFNELYDGIQKPDTGIVIHGLFIEAGRWDASQGGVCEGRVGELSPRLPAVWLKPCLELEVGGRYEAPLYKTSVRAGVLSTTGHSTNFVLAVLLESEKSPDFWILQGTALITLTTE